MIYPCNDNTVKQAVNILKGGGIIIYPTDTLYGFGVDATNSKAIEKLNELKNRQSPLSIIISSIKEIEKYGTFSSQNTKMIKTILPGPFTILIDSLKSNLSTLVNPNSDYIGIRIPNHQFPIQIVRLLGRPIVTTSVNKNKEPSLNNIIDMEKTFPNIDIFEDEINLSSKGSTIINLANNPYKIIRYGDGVL